MFARQGIDRQVAWTTSSFEKLESLRLLALRGKGLEVTALEQELNERAYDVIWVEERSFVFDCIVRFFRSTITTEDDPLAVLAMALLFHNLGESGACDEALSRVEDTLRALSDILNSGLQLRDCLVAGGYYYVARKAHRNMLAVDHIVLQRINFAATSGWFEDSGLAAIIALVSDEVQVGSEAKRYLRDRINAWLNNDYVLGVLHYCLIEDKRLSDQLINYLLKRDWSDDSITTLIWGLLTLGRLRKKGYKIRQTQYVIAQRILGILGNSDLVQAVVEGESDLDSLTTGSLTSFDFAFAACALNIEGFDSVIGVPRSQKEALDAIIGLKRLLARGGRIMPKWQVVVGEISFVVMLGFMTALIFYLAGRQSFWEFLGGVTATILLAALGVWLLRRRLPSEAALAIFGDATLQYGAEGETHEHENQPS